MKNTTKKVNSSFRDPSGEVYWCDNRLYRSIADSYIDTYHTLMSSGLYYELLSKGLIIPHNETHHADIIQPDIIPFISYPYEWSFGAYKDAALATLEIQKIALEHGMVLKDASAYNIQFNHGYPLLIDTLSFEEYQEGTPWRAYRQFCQHFLAPLAVMSIVDPRLSRLMTLFIDGIPLELASRLLPKYKFNFGILTHIHSQVVAQHNIHKVVKLTMHKTALLGLLDSLTSAVNSLGLRPRKGWSDYQHNTSYNDVAATAKTEIVRSLIEHSHPKTVWDLGANDGSYSALAVDDKCTVIAFDSDPYCVEDCYKHYRQDILPLVLDLTNPSPGIGWACQERMSLSERGPADLVMALALVHHLAISNNTPFSMIADWFSKLSKWLIIEFVPKDDLQAQKLLASRVDIFDNYTQENFELEFGKYYRQIERKDVSQSCRSIYLFQVK